MARAQVVEVENNIDDLKRGIREGIVKGLEALEDGTLDQIDEGFAREQDAMGRDWMRLSPYTVQQKGHDTILYEHGDLRNSFAGDLDAHNYELEIFTDDEKASIHEFGAPDANIPPRPMVKPAADWTQHEGMDEYFVPELQSESLEAIGVTHSGTDLAPGGTLPMDRVTW